MKVTLLICIAAMFICLMTSPVMAQGGYVGVGAVVTKEADSTVGFHISTGIPVSKKINIYAEVSLSDITETYQWDDDEGNVYTETFGPFSFEFHAGLLPQLVGGETWGIGVLAAPGLRNNVQGTKFNGLVGGSLHKTFGHVDLQFLPVAELEKGSRKFFAPRFIIGYRF